MLFLIIQGQARMHDYSEKKTIYQLILNEI